MLSAVAKSCEVMSGIRDSEVTSGICDLDWCRSILVLEELFFSGCSASECSLKLCAFCAVASVVMLVNDGSVSLTWARGPAS